MSTTVRGEVRPLSVAPMMACTDRHDRYFLRLISRHTLLYTEMVTTGAILYGERDDLLRFHGSEHPVALQLGGDDPVALAACARIAEQLGYDEVNLNVGCPSDRVKSGCFGASLMARPEVVRDAVIAMREAVAIPVTVKHRIGIDDIDTYDDMLRFVDVVAPSGADRFTVHARKAWLQGLSPKENRTIPPLRHHEVHRLKAERPHLVIETNGGIRTLDEASRHIGPVDAVMIGRGVYDNPYVLADADRRFFGDEHPVPSRHDVVRGMLDYVDDELRGGNRLHRITRHMLGLFTGQPGAKRWRRALSEAGQDHAAGPEALLAALEAVPEIAQEAARPAC